MLVELVGCSLSASRFLECPSWPKCSVREALSHEGVSVCVRVQAIGERIALCVAFAVKCATVEVVQVRIVGPAVDNFHQGVPNDPKCQAPQGGITFRSGRNKLHRVGAQRVRIDRAGAWRVLVDRALDG